MALDTNCDKSFESETYDFAFCVSSPKTNDSFSTVDVKILPKSDVKDPSPTNGFPSCSFMENVKPPRNLCNKSGISDRIHCKNNFVRTKTCFVCGSKSHLIKDCDVYDNVDNFPSVVSKAASVPAGRRNSSASILLVDPFLLLVETDQHLFMLVDIFLLVHPHVNKDIGIVDSGCSRSMTGNKEKLYDFVQVKGAFNFFSVSQICDKKNKVLFTDDECLVLTKEFQLLDESQAVLRIPRRHDLYTFNLSDIQPEQHINCLLAKASLEESTKWHRRKAHVNFKTINKLAKNGLVEGLPLKLFTNKHNCVTCNKRKQHKASYKAISIVRTIYEPLQLLHMDLFGPTSIRSIDQKYYSLVVTDDFSRTPQQNRVAERKNRTLIEATRSMLVDSKLPTMFWTEAVITACYVLNKVSITNPYNKTPYELLSGKVPNISHLKPFGCQVTILNTSDHLGKFKGKANEGFLVGYAANSKAYSVYNLSSKKVEETLNLRYLEDKPNV
nr:hypothetical protein [Tanacetum cinerariifolium]